MKIRDRINSVKNIIRNPYAWPGGYTKVMGMADGDSMCADCVKENYHQILRATRNNDRSGWAAWAADIHWEGAPLQCCGCALSLPSEYGDPEEV